jgi:hypothetical protein
LLLLADSSLTGHKAALALSLIIAERGASDSITADNELSKKAMAREEYTSAMARIASNFGYDSAKLEGTAMVVDKRRRWYDLENCGLVNCTISIGSSHKQAIRLSLRLQLFKKKVSLQSRQIHLLLGAWQRIALIMS